MADQKDQTKSKTDAAKQQAGTVLLTPEELRAISGGGSINNPNPLPPSPVSNSTKKQ